MSSKSSSSSAYNPDRAGPRFDSYSFPAVCVCVCVCPIKDLYRILPTRSNNKGLRKAFSSAKHCGPSERPSHSVTAPRRSPTIDLAPTLACRSQTKKSRRTSHRKLVSVRVSCESHVPFHKTERSRKGVLFRVFPTPFLVFFKGERSVSPTPFLKSCGRDGRRRKGRGGCVARRLRCAARLAQTLSLSLSLFNSEKCGLFRSAGMTREDVREKGARLSQTREQLALAQQRFHSGRAHRVRDGADPHLSCSVTNQDRFAKSRF